MANSSRENANNKPAGTIHFLTQVAMWYLFSVLFNIELKTFFNLYNAPFVITFANLFVSCLASASTMGKETIIDMEWNKMIRKLFFVGLFQFVGTLSTNLSISAMAVSFTHIIKATEPIFTIGWIAYLAYNKTIAHSGSIITKAQLFSISIVVIGVIMSSVSETTYSRAGLMFGLLSNISFAGRNVLLNSIMKEYRVGKEQLFLFSSVLGCVASLALAVLFEPHYLSLPSSAVFSLFYISIMYFLYNLVSFSVLQGVQPVTHAVTNCCKRLVIVFSSFAFFHVVPSHLSASGSLITIFGVACYSLLRNMQSDHPSVSMRSFKKAIILFILGGIVLYLLTTSIASPANNNITGVEDSNSNLSGITPGQLDDEEFTVDEEDELGYPPDEDEDEEFDEKRPYGPRGNFNPFSNANVVSRIQERVVEDFGPTFKGKKYAIFMGAPNYNNGGDTAIYLGSVNFLKIIGVRIIHECTDQQRWICRYNVSRQFIRKDPSTTIICLQGGGNMNDIYYMYEYQRITFISWFPNHSVALFPQSVKFWDKTKWNKSERAYSSSPDATLTARDERSFGLMKEHFPNQKVLLIPDMAFMIGHKQRPRMPEVDILCLMRKDGEKNKNVTVDYSAFPSHVTVATRSYWDPEHPEARRAYTPTEAAEIRTYAAMNIIAGAKVLISDRLHAHVMATLLDVPHVIVDNSYGKVTGNHNLWTKDCNGILVARSWPEAVEMGLRLLDQVNYYVYDNDMLETL